MRNFILTLAVALALPFAAAAQNITTVAGCGIGDDSLAAKAELVGPVAITFDTAGNAFIAESGEPRVRRVDHLTGTVSTIAGTGVQGNTGDGGPATAATIGTIYGIGFDRTGNLYIADANYCVVRKIDPSGTITTIAGTGTPGYGGDHGPATAALMNQPTDLAIDTAGNIYVADFYNNRVRKISTSGIMTSVVGNGGTTGMGNGGPATASSLGRPFRVAMDKKGNLVVAEVIFQCICKVDTGGIINIIADTTGAYSTGTDGDGGPALAAHMTSPCGLAIDTAGNIYFSDIGNDRIRKIDAATGIVNDFAASAPAGFGGDGGPATAAKICTPEGLACDKAGNVYICDADNNRVRKVNTSGIISTFAGRNALFGEGYAAINSELCGPASMVTDAAGNVYFADYNNNRIRKIDMSTGLMTTAAGSGIAGYDDGYNGDNIAATAANIYNPTAVAIDNSGNLYIADANNNRVRKVNASTGIITTIAGNGIGGYNGNSGPAVNMELYYPTGVAVDAAGNVYIADQQNQRIRKVDTTGHMTTVAGVGVAGFSGDGIAATATKLNYPVDVAVDGLGNIYIADAVNCRIRKVDTAGMMSTVAGSGTPGYNGDNIPANTAQLKYPSGVKATMYGDIFIADQSNERVRWVNPSGTIFTVAGNGTAGFSGDGGPAVAAKLNQPYSLAVDATGNLYISDFSNDRIRKVTLPLGVQQAHAVKWSVAAYPDPAHDVLYVDVQGAQGKVSLTLTDMTGREVLHTVSADARQTLDLSKLTTGMYLLRVMNENGEMQTVKVVRE